MRPFSLPNAALAFTLAFSGAACGRKGDPVPHARVEPRAPEARFLDLRTLEVVLPAKDVRGQDLVGLEKLRVLYLPVGHAKPSATEVLGKGEVVLESRRPDLPRPGKALRLDLRDLDRPAGWIIVVAVRVGEVVGAPTEPLPWLDKAF